MHLMYVVRAPLGLRVGTFSIMVRKKVSYNAPTNFALRKAHVRRSGRVRRSHHYGFKLKVSERMQSQTQEAIRVFKVYRNLKEIGWQGIQPRRGDEPLYTAT